MAAKKVEVYQAIKQSFVLPLFSSSESGEAVKVVSLLKEAGCPVAELTHREVGSYRVFEQVRAKFPPGEMLLGAGSIVDAATAAMYLAAGADFIVGPSFNPEVLKHCNRVNVLAVPGCGTLTEILTAYECGALLVKIFPAGTVGGPAFLKAVTGPCPWVEAIPTGGVEPTGENLKAWKQAGAAAVGLGSNLLSKDLIKSGKWPELGKNIQALVRLAGTV